MSETIFKNRGNPRKLEKINAQARNRTGGSTMATLNFTTKPLAPAMSVKFLLCIKNYIYNVFDHIVV